MKIRTLFLLGIFHLLGALALAQPGQAFQNPTPSSEASPNVLTPPQGPEDRQDNAAVAQQTAEVFITFDDLSAQDTKLKGIGAFAVDLLRLRLLSSMSSAIVHRGGGQQPCRNQQPGQNAALNESSQPAVSPKDSNTAKQAPARKAELRGTARYYVSGSIHLIDRSTFGTPSVGIRYVVRKCTGNKEFLLIPTQDLSFPANQTLDELNWIASNIFHQIQNEIPREPVWIHECTLANNSQLDDSLKPFADQIKTRIVEKINGSSEFQASSGDTESAVFCSFVPKFHGFLAKASLVGALREETLEARISVRTNAQEKPYQDPDFASMKWSDRKLAGTANTFADDTASKALGALRFVRAAERLGLGKQLDEWQADGYLQQGKTLLCVDACLGDPDPKSALEALLRAKKLDSSDPAILRYLGQAQNGNRTYADAKASLEEALNKLKPPQKKTQLEAEINVQLGDALIGLGAPADAADRYLKGLEIYKLLPDGGEGREVAYLKYARALTQNNQRSIAVAALLQALQAFPLSQELHHQTLNLIRQMSAGELDAAHKDYVDRYCKEPGPIKNECALLWVQRAARSNEETPNLANVLSFSAKGRELQPPDVQIHAEALGYMVVATLDTDPVKSDVFLTEAEELPNKDISPETRAWLRRLRSTYWLQKQDFEKAYRVAKAALTEYPEDRATSLTKAAIAVAWTEALQSKPEMASLRTDLFKEARDVLVPLVVERYAGADDLLAVTNHALQKDTDSRDRFIEILNRNPQDDSALQTVLWVCIEWMSDFDCSLKAARKSAEIGFRNKTLEIQLDLIEAAMLKGEDEEAEQWLKIVGERVEFPPDLRTVRDFYAVWLALKKKDDPGAQLSFASWKDGVTLLRNKDAKGEQGIGWSFTGAKTVWRRSRLPEATLYLDMVKSMEKPQLPLPSLPPRP